MSYSDNAEGWKYAPDVTYQNGAYTLTSKTISGTTYDVEVKSDVSGTNLIYHHYTCGSSTNATCSEIKYVNRVYDNSGIYRVYYITLTNGVKIEQALNEMLTNSSNTTSSTIKITLDTWYSTNMVNYTNMLEDTPYCNDRSVYLLGGWNPEGGHLEGDGIDVPLLFTSYQRSMNTNIPSVTCNKNESFTVSESTLGNGKLTYPIGLITNDEITMAGGKGGTANITYYLNTNQNYWSESPRSVYRSDAYSWYVYSIGNLLNGSYVNNSLGVRGLVSLKPGTRISRGTGTVADPFIIG